MVPWCGWDEWRSGGACLLGGLREGRAEAVGEGLALVAGWRVRGRVPLAVDATAELVGAVAAARGLVPGGTPGPGRHCLRLSLAMAIVRLVNGVVAPAQKGKFARPVSGVARELRLPSLLVDIRHDATHQELPALPLLLTAADAALGWLEEHYWGRQEAALLRLEEDLKAAVAALIELCVAEVAEAAPAWGVRGGWGGASDGGGAKRPKGWFKEERQRARARLAELCPSPLGRLAAPAISDCPRLHALTDRATGEGDEAHIHWLAWCRCMEAMSAHWGASFGGLLRQAAEATTPDLHKSSRLKVVQACSKWLGERENGNGAGHKGSDRTRVDVGGCRSRAGLQDEEGTDELPPGGLFSGASEREGRKRKKEIRKERARFRRVLVEDWEPCALGNLPDLNDLNGTPPPLLGLSPVGTLGSGAATFQPGPEPCGAEAATEAPRVGGCGRARPAEEAQTSDEEAAGVAPAGEDKEELYIRLL